MVTFLETATRLLVMQIIDVMLSEGHQQSLSTKLRFGFFPENWWGLDILSGFY